VARYARDARVIYGDTDSVMVNFGTAEVKDAMVLGTSRVQEMISNRCCDLHILGSRLMVL